MFAGAKVVTAVELITENRRTTPGIEQGRCDPKPIGCMKERRSDCGKEIATDRHKRSFPNPDDG